MRTWLCISFVVLLFTGVHAQTKRVVAIGSSTTAGANTSTDSSYVGRLQAYFRKNVSGSNPDTVVTRMAVYGHNTWNQLPESYTPAIEREPVDPNINLTEAMALNPDVVIINLPSNDVADAYQNSWPGYTISETMDNFRAMYSYVVSNGAICFITTTQPRGDIPPAYRELQRRLKDSILAEFGSFAINFWDDLVTSDGSNVLKNEVRSSNVSDQLYHLNEVGHRYIFQRVVDADIFLSTPLPLLISAFNADVRGHTILLSWETAVEEPLAYFKIQRSKDGSEFETLASVNAIGTSHRNQYTWKDLNPVPGRCYYRLEIVDAGGKKYSNVLAVTYGKYRLITRSYFSSGLLNIELHARQKENAKVELYNASGAQILNQKTVLENGINQFSIPAAGLSTGTYLVVIRTESGKADSYMIIKQD